MLNETTVNKLYEMRLSVMAQNFRDQCLNSGMAELSFEERFGLLVDSEWSARKNSRLSRLIRKADFVFSDACIEDIEYHPDRNLDKAQIMRLGTCNYIQEAHNLIILGATGSGKTYLANAFGMSACRNFYTVKYIRLPELLGELIIARGEGNYRPIIKAYKQVKLLILDEWLLWPLKEAEARDLLEIVEARYKRASTIFCSQLAVGGWHDKIGEPTLADAISDRIVHDSYSIIIEGRISMRERKGLIGVERKP
jgi:DNA replication protein DnaC